MDNFILFLAAILLMMFAYHVGFTVACRSVRKYIRKETGKIITQYGKEPAQHQAQTIVNDLMNFLHEYTDDNNK